MVQGTDGGMALEVRCPLVYFFLVLYESCPFVNIAISVHRVKTFMPAAAFGQALLFLVSRSLDAKRLEL